VDVMGIPMHLVEFRQDACFSALFLNGNASLNKKSLPFIFEFYKLKNSEI
jgi:hypothetical protein